MQTKFVSPDNSEKFILIERNRLWENVRIIYNGKVIQSYKYATDTREGVTFEVEGLGTVSLKVHAVTLHPTLFVDGSAYHIDGDVKRANRRLLIPVIIFGLLSALNIAPFIVAVHRMQEDSGYVLYQIVMIVFSFFLLSYLTTTIFLWRRVYFFYFYGTAIFALSTVYVFGIFAFNPFELYTLIFLIVRLLVLGVLLRFFKRAVYLFQNRNVSYVEQDVIDEKLAP